MMVRVRDINNLQKYIEFQLNLQIFNERLLRFQNKGLYLLFLIDMATKHFLILTVLLFSTPNTSL